MKESGSNVAGGRDKLKSWSGKMGFDDHWMDTACKMFMFITCLLSLFILTTDLKGMSYFSHFAGEEFKSKESKITWPRVHNWQRQHLKVGMSDAKLVVFPQNQVAPSPKPLGWLETYPNCHQIRCSPNLTVPILFLKPCGPPSGLYAKSFTSCYQVGFFTHSR